MSEQARSRIEAILGNMLGGDYTIEEPMSRNEVLLLGVADKLSTIEEALEHAGILPITDDQIDDVLDDNAGEG